MFERKAIKVFLWFFRPVADAAWRLHRLAWRIEQTATQREYEARQFPHAAGSWRKLWAYYGRH